MASNLYAGLGFDKDDFSNKFILIGEQNTCDSSFLTGSLIWQGLYRTGKDTAANICMLSLHNSLEHYENIAVKLGYNIDSYIKKGNFRFLEGFKIVNKYFSNLVFNETNNDFSDVFLKDLFFDLKQIIDSFLNDKNSCCYLIIDDLSDFLSAGFSLKSVLSFVKYLRTFLSSVDGFSLIIGTHFNENDNEQCVLYKNLYRVADFCILVSGLKTGFSLDVSGSINIVRKFIDPPCSLRKLRADFYHFKLLDRQVKIFSPGMVQ